MNNEENIPMSEFLPMFAKFATDIQAQINAIQTQMIGLQEQISDLRQEINQRFEAIDQRLDYHETWLNRIEKNMATKTQFNSLLKVLERKSVVCSYEASHITNTELVA